MECCTDTKHRVPPHSHGVDTACAYLQHPSQGGGTQEADGGGDGLAEGGWQAPGICCELPGSCQALCFSIWLMARGWPHRRRVQLAPLSAGRILRAVWEAFSQLRRSIRPLSEDRATLDSCSVLRVMTWCSRLVASEETRLCYLCFCVFSCLLFRT